jgi:hypothetical protein
MSAGPPDDGDTPAEQRVHGLLSELRSDPLPPSTDLAVRVVRRARWQRPLKSVLDLAGGLAGAVAQGAALLFGRRRRHGGAP